MPVKDYIFDGVRTWRSLNTDKYADIGVGRGGLVIGTYKPDASTTGPLPGTSFTTINTALTISTPGAIYNGYIFNNTVTLNALNVKFYNCIFHGYTPAGSTAPQQSNMVRGTSGSTSGGMGGATFEDCEFTASTPRGQSWVHGMNSGGFTARRCHIHNTVDGIGLTGPLVGTLIEGCYIHDGSYQTGDPSDPLTPVNSDGQTHNDGIQFHRGKNITVRGNFIGGFRNPANNTPALKNVNNHDYNNACIMIGQIGTSLADKTENVLIEKNWFEGGAAGINVAPGNGNDYATLTIRDNKFARRMSGESFLYIILNAGTMAVCQNNKMEDTGLGVPISNYTGRTDVS